VAKWRQLLAIARQDSRDVARPYQNKDELWNAFLRALKNVEYAQDPAYTAADDWDN
jgi:hypothetical protein